MISKEHDEGEKYCSICGSAGATVKHHIIPGIGKRKQQETKWSMVELCLFCHSFVHSSKGFEKMLELKLELQRLYFSQGKSEDEVRTMMGGKLYLKDGEIFR